jgi:hypothetical protein
MYNTFLPPVPGPRSNREQANVWFCYTRSGAVYVVTDDLAVRFRGHDMRAHRLASPVPMPRVGDHLKASVITEHGQARPICSNRLVRVAAGPCRIGARVNSDHMNSQEVRLYEATMALAEVGYVS